METAYFAGTYLRKGVVNHFKGSFELLRSQTSPIIILRGEIEDKNSKFPKQDLEGFLGPIRGKRIVIEFAKCPKEDYNGDLAPIHYQLVKDGPIMIHHYEGAWRIMQKKFRKELMEKEFCTKDRKIWIPRYERIAKATFDISYIAEYPSD